MYKYYLKLSGSSVTGYFSYVSSAAPSGLTEVTKSVYDQVATYLPSKLLTYSGGTLTIGGDRAEDPDRVYNDAFPADRTAFEHLIKAVNALLQGTAHPTTEKTNIAAWNTLITNYYNGGGPL